MCSMAMTILIIVCVFDKTSTVTVFYPPHIACSLDMYILVVNASINDCNANPFTSARSPSRNWFAIIFQMTDLFNKRMYIFHEF